MARYVDEFALIEIRKKFKGFEYEQVQVSEGVKDKQGFDSEQLKEVRVSYAPAEKTNGVSKVTVKFDADDEQLGLVFTEVNPNRKVRAFDDELMELFNEIREDAEKVLEDKGFDIMEADKDE